MKVKGTKTIETPRLILRKITLNDAPQMFANWASDPDVTAYLSWPAHQSIDVTKNIIAEWVRQYDSDLFFQWVIELKSNKEVIGTISIFNVNESEKSGEIGYCIGKKYWGQGIMSEVLKYIISYLTNETDFEVITGRHDVDNPASGKVMVKNGFVFETNKTEHSKKNNSLIVVSCYRLDLRK